MLFASNNQLCISQKQYNIVISNNQNNIDLKSLVIQNGWDGTTPVIAMCTVKYGVVIGSNSTSLYALTCSGFTTGSKITLILENNSYIVGAGGNGAYQNWGNAGNGGENCCSTVSLTINNSGIIGGGGGAGSSPGTGGGSNGPPAGNPGTLLTGGAAIHSSVDTSYYAGKGGDLGQPGDPGTPATYGSPGGWGTKSGGAAGKAIEGISYVTWINRGTVLGATI